MKPTICLVSLPSPFLVDDKTFPNLGVLYLSAALKLHGVQAMVHDGLISEIPQGFSFYGISATTPQYHLALQAKDKILAENPHSKIIIGGAHATVDPESCKRDGFDSVVIGCGERSLPLVMSWNCDLISTPYRAYIRPDRDAIDLSKYHYEIDGIPATSVMTSRGCPYSCAFCCKSAGKVFLYPADEVIEELRSLKDDYGYNAFMFFDDIFVSDPNRLSTIAKAITPWNVRWRGFARADMLVHLYDSDLHEMANSGCAEIGIGIESGSDKILEIIQKGEDIATIKQAIRMLHRHGIRVKGFFIVGLPSESRETISDTIQFCSEVQLDDVDFTVFQPYKGSYIYNHKEDFDIKWVEKGLRELWYKGRSGTYFSNVWTSQLTQDEIVDARDYLERRFKP